MVDRMGKKSDEMTTEVSAWINKKTDTFAYYEKATKSLSSNESNRGQRRTLHQARHVIKHPRQSLSDRITRNIELLMRVFNRSMKLGKLPLDTLTGDLKWELPLHNLATHSTSSSWQCGPCLTTTKTLFNERKASTVVDTHHTSNTSTRRSWLYLLQNPP